MSSTSRRTWLARFGWTSAAALLTAPFRAIRAGTIEGDSPSPMQDDPLHEHDRWLQPLTARHRQLIDIVQPADTAGFNYALTFLYANVESYKRRDSDVNVVVVLRDRASVLALSDAVWADFKIGEQFGITDPTTKLPSVRNVHAKRGPEGPNVSAAIDALQNRGVTVVACGTALRTHAAQTARRLGVDPAAAREAWVKAVLPNVLLVPAGILAINAAQRRGFAYAAAGG